MKAAGRRLFLFTDTFPYGYGESFLADEYPYLEQTFEKISIYPQYYVDRKKKVLQPASQERSALSAIAHPLLRCHTKDKKFLLVQGLFNFSPIGFLFTEMWNRKVWKSAKKMKILLTSVLTTRAVLASQNYRQLCQDFKKMAVEKDDTVNILYFYWGDRTVQLLPFLKKRLPENSRVIVRFHGSDLYEEVKGYIPFREKIFQCTDTAYPISEDGGRYLRQKYPFLLKDIRVRHLGSAGPEENTFDRLSQTYTFEPHTLHILSLSNIIPLKRVHLIAKALLDIQASDLAPTPFTKILWTHIGDGSGREALEETIAKTLKADFACGKIESGHLSIELTGKIPHDQVMQYMTQHRIDLFINASSSEGIPVSIMEAISFGIPVMATQVGGVHEILDNCGILLPAELDADLLRKEILKFTQMQEEVVLTMRSAARKTWSEHWNKDKIYPAFVHEISKI